MTTVTDAPIGVSIREAATVLGLSPNAVRMRIRHKTLAAFKDGEQWRVLLNGSAAPAEWSHTSGYASRPTSVETDHPPVTPVAQAQLAAVIREAVAPFIEELGQVQRRLGATERELVHERERREAIEHEYEVAKKEVAALRLLARSENRRQEATERASAVSEHESVVQPPNDAPGGTDEAERANAPIAAKQRWPWWMRLLGGK